MTDIFHFEETETFETDQGRFVKMRKDLFDALGKNTLDLDEICTLALGAYVNRSKSLVAIRPMVNHVTGAHTMDGLLDIIRKERGVKATAARPKTDKGLFTQAMPAKRMCTNIYQPPGGQPRPCHFQLKGPDKRCPRCSPCKLCSSKGHTKTWHIEGGLACQEQNKANGNLYSSFKLSNRSSPKYKKQNHIVLCLDSGATITMVNDSRVLENFQQVISDIITASGDGIESPGQGILAISDRLKLLAKYVPELSTNLLAVRQLTDMGCVVSFSKEAATVTLQGMEVLQAYFTDDLWQVTTNATSKALRVRSQQLTNKSQARPRESPEAKLTHTQKTTWMELHSRLNHVNIIDLQPIAKLDNMLKIHGDLTAVADCEVCIQGKMTQGTFPTGKAHRATAPGEILLVDVCDMTVTSLWGYRYYLYIQDDYSRYGETFLLTTRDKASNITDMIIKFINITENKFKAGVKTIRSDNEFRYNQLETYCRDKGITQELTTRDTSQQNRIAERGIRTVTDGAICALVHATHSYS